MNKISSTVIALALVVIALNMTYSNLHKETIQESSKGFEERVLPVVGRTWTVFEGLGATVGFLVKDGENLKIVRYDQGSMAANDAFQPKYMLMAKFANGETSYQPLTVDAFH